MCIKCVYLYFSSQFYIIFYILLSMFLKLVQFLYRILVDISHHYRKIQHIFYYLLENFKYINLTNFYHYFTEKFLNFDIFIKTIVTVLKQKHSSVFTTLFSEKKQRKVLNFERSQHLTETFCFLLERKRGQTLILSIHPYL